MQDILKKIGSVCLFSPGGQIFSVHLHLIPFLPAA